MGQEQEQGSDHGAGAGAGLTYFFLKMKFGFEIAFGRMKIISFTLLSAAVCTAQQAGTNVKEMHPPLPMTTCNSAGECTQEATAVVLDQNWRWTHGKQSANR